MSKPPESAGSNTAPTPDPTPTQGPNADPNLLAAITEGLAIQRDVASAQRVEDSEEVTSQDTLERENASLADQLIPDLLECIKQKTVEGKYELFIGLNPDRYRIGQLLADRARALGLKAAGGYMPGSTATYERSGSPSWIGLSVNWQHLLPEGEKIPWTPNPMINWGDHPLLW